jgi:hypothetical protein
MRLRPKDRGLTQRAAKLPSPQSGSSLNNALPILPTKYDDRDKVSVDFFKKKPQKTKNQNVGVSEWMDRPVDLRPNTTTTVLGELLFFDVRYL